MILIGRLGAALLAIMLLVPTSLQPFATGQDLSGLGWSQDSRVVSINSATSNKRMTRYYNVHTKVFGPATPSAQLSAAQLKSLGVAMSADADGNLLRPTSYYISPDDHYVVYQSQQLVGDDGSNSNALAGRILLGDLRTGQVWDTSAWSYTGFGMVWNASSSSFVVTVVTGESIEATTSWYMSGYKEGDSHIVRREIPSFKLGNHTFDLEWAALLSNQDGLFSAAYDEQTFATRHVWLDMKHFPAGSVTTIPDDLNDAVFVPGSSTDLFISRPMGVFEYNLLTGAMTVIDRQVAVKVDTADVCWPEVAFSPNGAWLAYTRIQANSDCMTEAFVVNMVSEKLKSCVQDQGLLAALTRESDTEQYPSLIKDVEKQAGKRIPGLCANELIRMSRALEINF